MNNSEKGTAQDGVGASVDMNVGQYDTLAAKGRYDVVCCGADGVEKWRDTIENLITTVGKNDMLERYLSGSSYTAAFFMGLISLASYSAIAAANTMASHAGWLEAGIANAPTYSQPTRPAPAWAAAASGSKATSAAVVFSITGTGTVKGVFLTTIATKDGVTGTLFSAGLFTGGDKAVGVSDTLNVTYSLAV